MKLNNKTQKGITLVALIITIIVLLILAVVAIRAVTGDGIIAHAKNARDSYNQAQTNEQATLNTLLDQIEDETSNVTLLTFSCYGKEYIYEEGMTWKDWINNPKYDSEPFYIAIGYDNKLHLMYMHPDAGELYVDRESDGIRGPMLADYVINPDEFGGMSA